MRPMALQQPKGLRTQKPHVHIISPVTTTARHLCNRPRCRQPFSSQGSEGRVGLVDRVRTGAAPSGSNETEENTSAAAGPKGPFLSDTRTREVAFGSLAVTSTLLGVMAVFSPNLMCFLLLGGPAPELELIYTRIAGLTMACAAVAEGSLADAAANDRLGSATYQRLMVACMVKSALYMGTLALHPGICNPQILALFIITNSLSIGIHYTVYKQTNNNKGPPFPWTDPTNTASIIYTVIGVLYVITAASCLLPPSSTASVFSGKITLQSSFLQHLWIPGYLLSSALCYILKDAAERDRLAGGTFRRLNLGLCLLELGFSVQLGSAMAGGLAPLNTANYFNLALSQLIAAYMGWQWRFSVKPPQPPALPPKP